MRKPPTTRGIVSWSLTFFCLLLSAATRAHPQHHSIVPPWMNDVRDFCVSRYDNCNPMDLILAQHSSLSCIIGPHFVGTESSIAYGPRRRDGPASAILIGLGITLKPPSINQHPVASYLPLMGRYSSVVFGCTRHYNRHCSSVWPP